MELRRKLAILADAAKYDASCASSGAREAGLAGTARASARPTGIGHLPHLHAGRPLRLAAEDPADQLLRLRLPLLRQPRQLEQRAARALHGRGGRRADARLLPAQLHRGPVPQLRASSAAPDYTMEQLVEVARTPARGRTSSAATSTSRPSPRPSADADRARPGATPTGCSINIELPRDGEPEARSRREKDAWPRSGRPWRAARGSARRGGAAREGRPPRPSPRPARARR